MAIAREVLYAGFLNLLQRGRDGDWCDESEARFLAQALTGAFIQLMLWWLEEGTPETPETMNRWFTQLSQSVLDANRSSGA